MISNRRTDGPRDNQVAPGAGAGGVNPIDPEGSTVRERNNAGLFDSPKKFVQRLSKGIRGFFSTQRGANLNATVHDEDEIEEGMHAFDLAIYRGEINEKLENRRNFLLTTEFIWKYLVRSEYEILIEDNKYYMEKMKLVKKVYDLMTDAEGVIKIMNLRMLPLEEGEDLVELLARAKIKVNVEYLPGIPAVKKFIGDDDDKAEEIVQALFTATDLYPGIRQDEWKTIAYGGCIMPRYRLYVTNRLRALWNLLVGINNCINLRALYKEKSQKCDLLRCLRPE